MPKGMNDQKLRRALSKHVSEVNQAIDDLRGSTDLKDIADRLILTLSRTSTIVSRMDSEEYEVQL